MLSTGGNATSSPDFMTLVWLRSSCWPMPSSKLSKTNSRCVTKCVGSIGLTSVNVSGVVVGVVVVGVGVGVVVGACPLVGLLA